MARDYCKGRQSTSLFEYQLFQLPVPWRLARTREDSAISGFSTLGTGEDSRRLNNLRLHYPRGSQGLSRFSFWYPREGLSHFSFWYPRNSCGLSRFSFSTLEIREDSVSYAFGTLGTREDSSHISYLFQLLVMVASTRLVVRERRRFSPLAWDAVSPRLGHPCCINP